MVSQQNPAARSLGVVIPTIGERPELRQMLISVLAQTRPVQAIRIVVDASDTSLVDEIVGKLSDQLGSVDVTITVTGADRGAGVYLVETGYGFAVNRGLETLDTDLVAFLDDDDEILPSHFAQLEAALDPDAGRGAAYSRVRVVSPEGDTHLFPDGAMPQGRIGAGVLIDAHPVLLPATLIHRSVLDVVGMLDESLDREADTDMIVRLGLATELVAVDDPTYVYNRISRKAVVNERSLAERARLLHKHGEHLSKRERLRLWDPIGRSALRAGMPEIGRDAAEQVVLALSPRAPRFLIGWYVALRERQTPAFVKKAIKRISGSGSSR